MPSEPSSPRTFRIDADVMRTLEEEARKQGATVNGLTCRILRKYVKIGVRLEPFGMLYMPRTHMISLINAIEDNALVDIASDMGKRTAKEAILQLYGELSMQSFKQYIEIYLCGYSNWASYYEEDRGSVIEVRMGHSMGDKWSLFMKNFLESALEEMVGKKPNFKYVSAFSLIFEMRKEGM